MSPYRIADAARISPYPHTIRAQEPERSDASASGSGSGGSPSKARLMAEAAARAARNGERSTSTNARQGQSEERFNVGPRSTRSLIRGRNGRGGRAGRAALEGIEEGVPNYPPPSFQEAMGTPVVPRADEPGSSSVLCTASEAQPPRPIEYHQELSESEASVGRHSPSDTPSASESEDSMEIIHSQGREGHENGPEGQRIEFPSTSLSPGPSRTNTTIAPSSVSIFSRRRAKSKLSCSAVDPNQDISEKYNDANSSIVRSPKRSFLSLSPLRTLFPPKHQALQPRALSAHPPGTSPYGNATPRSTQFFRSTTSLASSSVLRFPFNPSTLTLTVNKPEQAPPESVKSSSRRFFGKEKGRERGKHESEKHESWQSERDESWEVVDGDTLDSEADDAEEFCQTEHGPPSLMAMIVPMPPDPPSPSVVSPEVSPTRSLSFTYGASPAPTTQSPRIIEPRSAPTQTQSAPSWNEPHPLSLRDKKCAEAMELFQQRRPRNDGGHHRSKTTPNPTVIISPPVSPGAGPPVTTVRTRISSPLHQNVQSATNASADSHSKEERQEATTPAEGWMDSGRRSHDFRKALETPLPSSPTRPSCLPAQPIYPPSVPSSPASVTINITSPTVSSPTTPVAPRSGGRLCDGQGLGVQSSQTLTPRAIGVLDMPVQEPSAIECACLHSSVPPSGNVNGIYRHSSPSPSPSPRHPQHKCDMSMSSSPLAGRRHYVGRPLPRPPQSPQPSRNAVVDSIYAGHESFVAQPSASPSTAVPEGLLIDLENDDEESNMSGYWTPPIEDHSHYLSPRCAPMTPDRTSPVNSSMNTPDHSIRSLPLSFSPGNVSSISELTDLDLLAAAVGEGSSGVDYEDLLMRREPTTSTWARMPSLVGQTCYLPGAWRFNEGGSQRMGVSS